MDNVSVLFLGGDLAVAIAGIYLLKQYWSADATEPVEIAVAIGSGILLNGLFMTASPVVGVFHAAIAGLVAWYFYGQVSTLLMPM